MNPKQMQSDLKNGVMLSRVNIEAAVDELVRIANQSEDGNKVLSQLTMVPIIDLSSIKLYDRDSIVATSSDKLRLFYAAADVRALLIKQEADARAVLSAAPTEPVRTLLDGWTVAPLEPTELMMHAAEDVPAPRTYGEVYRCMLEAMPIYSDSRLIPDDLAQQAEETNKPAHEKIMAGYDVACRFGVYESKAFDLVDAMYEVLFAPQQHAQAALSERNAFEAWMREECGADDDMLKRPHEGRYLWARTGDMWAAYQASSQKQLMGADEQADAWVAVSVALDKGVPGWLSGPLSGLDSAVKAISELCAKRQAMTDLSIVQAANAHLTTTDYIWKADVDQLCAFARAIASQQPAAAPSAPADDAKFWGHVYDWLHLVETKIGTPTAAAAARVLKEFYEGVEPATPAIQQEGAALDSLSRLKIYQFKDEGVNNFAKKAYFLASDVRAALAAQPNYHNDPTVQGMADCMDMVRQELIEAGVITPDIAPMFIANVVAAKFYVLIGALKDITADICERFDMDSTSTNPGIKSCVENSLAALAAAGVAP